MLELSKERIDQIVHEETPKTEELPTVLRSIYVRYMHLYEKYFSDLDALNDSEIAELKKYHDETASLMKYYYIDIPMDVYAGLEELDERYTSKLLGPGWHKYIFGHYNDFKGNYKNIDKSEECLKVEFRERVMEAFYDTMDYIFREDLGTGSKMLERIGNGIAEFFSWE